MPTAAEQHCLDIARNHYENFPVASLFLPKNLRIPFAVIYAFSRTVDDFADEGDCPDGERRDNLHNYGEQLDAAVRGEKVGDPGLIACAEVIHRHELPVQPFHDLITAFLMDVDKKRYQDFGELLGYCRYSANPVGRLLLHLSGNASEQNLEDSDQICSALQIINFLQDLEQDYHELGRIYMPAEDMQRFGVTEEHFRDRISDAHTRQLVDFELERARKMMLDGSVLGKRLKGMFGLEIRMIIAGGLKICDALARQENVFSRPRLERRDRLSMIWQALRGNYGQATR